MLFIVGVAYLMVHAVQPLRIRARETRYLLRRMASGEYCGRARGFREPQNVGQSDRARATRGQERKVKIVMLYRCPLRSTELSYFNRDLSVFVYYQRLDTWKLV